MISLKLPSGYFLPRADLVFCATLSGCTQVQKCNSGPFFISKFFIQLFGRFLDYISVCTQITAECSHISEENLFNCRPGFLFSDLNLNEERYSHV